MKRLAFISLVAVLCACGKIGDEIYISTIKFEVQQDTDDTKVSYIKHEDFSYSLTWEEGDEISFLLYVLKPANERGSGGVYFDDDILFSASGKLVFTSSGWDTFVKSGSDYVKAETLEISSTKKDASLHLQFNYDYRGDSIPMSEWFTVGYQRRFDFVEGDQTVVLDLSDMFGSREQFG